MLILKILLFKKNSKQRIRSNHLLSKIQFGIVKWQKQKTLKKYKNIELINFISNYINILLYEIKNRKKENN